VRGKAEDLRPSDELADLPPPPDDPREAVRDLARTPMYLILVPVFAGINPVATVFLTWMPTFLHEKFGMSVAWAGLYGTIWIHLTSVLGVLAGGWLADRWARRSRGGRMMTQALGLFAGAPFLFLTDLAPALPVLILEMVASASSRGSTTRTSGRRSSTWSGPAGARRPRAS
jgi:hypothetical protein